MCASAILPNKTKKTEELKVFPSPIIPARESRERGVASSDLSEFPERDSGYALSRSKSLYKLNLLCVLERERERLEVGESEESEERRAVRAHGRALRVAATCEREREREPRTKHSANPFPEYFTTLFRGKTAVEARVGGGEAAEVNGLGRARGKLVRRGRRRRVWRLPLVVRAVATYSTLSRSVRFKSPSSKDGVYDPNHSPTLKDRPKPFKPSPPISNWNGL